MNLVTPIGEHSARSRRLERPMRALPLDTIVQGDCIAEMARLPDNSVDMIFALVGQPRHLGDAVALDDGVERQLAFGRRRRADSSLTLRYSGQQIHR
jgi:hypothetical protein